MHLGEYYHSQCALEGNSQCRSGVPGTLIVKDYTTSRIGQCMSKHATLAVTQTQGQHGCRDRPRIHGNQPGRLCQRLHSGVARSAALYFPFGRFRDYNGSQVPQQINEPHFGQQDDRRRVDDPECNHALPPP